MQTRGWFKRFVFFLVEVIECAICHESTQALAKLLENPANERTVENFVEKICSKLPAKYYERVSTHCPKLINKNCYLLYCFESAINTKTLFL